MRTHQCKTVFKPLAIIAFGLLLAACGGSGGGEGSITAGNGSFTLGVTDAPVDGADAVVVRFTGVEIIASDGDSNSETTLVTFSEPKTIDLLSLQGGLREVLLSGQTLPAGSYGQIRLLVQAEHDNVMDSYITISGAQHELRVPSGNQTGLKLVHTFDLASDGSKDFTIDFDLRKSIVFAPGQGYMLKPVLRLVETASAASISGIIDPNVFSGQTCGTDPLVSYAVYVYSGSSVSPDDVGSPTQPVATAKVKLNETSQYAYAVGFLEAGAYTVSATCQAHLDEPEVNNEIAFAGTANVTVTAGTTTTHNF